MRLRLISIVLGLGLALSSGEAMAQRRARISTMVAHVGIQAGQGAELSRGVAAGLRQWLRNQSFLSSSPEQLGVDSPACQRNATCLERTVCELELTALVTVEAREFRERGDPLLDLRVEVRRCRQTRGPGTGTIRRRVVPPGDALALMNEVAPIVRDLLYGRSNPEDRAAAELTGQRETVIPRQPTQSRLSRYEKVEPMNLTPWVIGIAAAGGAALAGGIGLSIKSVDTARGIREKVRDGAAQQSRIDQGEREVLWSRVLYGMSGAFVTIALGLHFFGDLIPQPGVSDTRERNPWSMRMAPSLLPGGGGVSVELTP